MTLQGLLNAKVFFSPLLYFVYSKSKRKVDDQLLEFALLSHYYRPTINVSTDLMLPDLLGHPA
mgnify:CR=1 FL=1